METIVAEQDKREFGILRDERIDTLDHKDITPANRQHRTRVEDKRRYARSRWNKLLNKVSGSWAGGIDSG